MTTFTHILVPTDFGEPAQRALDFALELASKFDAKVTLLHASWLPPVAYAAFNEGMYWPADELEAEAQKALDAALEKARERYPRVAGAVVRGEPRQTILDEAQRLGCDLVVIGTHGRRGVSRLFLGSVAERVVRLSPVPVLTVSGKADQPSRTTAPIHAEARGGSEATTH